MKSINDTIEILRKYYIWVYGVVGCVVFLLVIMVNKSDLKKKERINQKELSSKKNDFGVNIGEVDQKVYLTRLEKSYFDSLDRMKKMEKQMKSLQLHQETISSTILKINEHLSKQRKKQGKFLNDDLDISLKAKNNPKNLELAIAQIVPLSQQMNNKMTYLPLGSVCKGTLITGVYASADQNNPLPVLIRLDEAFYGPNNTRIPLKGAFVLGKAYGDLVSQRALIQIIAISSVLPDGTTFESQKNLGYVTDSQGELGIQGQVIRNTGKQLALSFMSGFMSGGSQALADQEVTQVSTDSGNISRNITGNLSKNAIFSGLAKSAGKLSDYYSKQTNDLVPAIHVSNGQIVYFIVQKGITIHGLYQDSDLAYSNTIE